MLTHAIWKLYDFDFIINTLIICCKRRFKLHFEIDFRRDVATKANAVYTQWMRLEKAHGKIASAKKRENSLYVHRRLAASASSASFETWHVRLFFYNIRSFFRVFSFLPARDGKYREKKMRRKKQYFS